MREAEYKKFCGVGSVSALFVPFAAQVTFVVGALLQPKSFVIESLLNNYCRTPPHSLRSGSPQPVPFFPAPSGHLAQPQGALRSRVGGYGDHFCHIMFRSSTFILK